MNPLILLADWLDAMHGYTLGIVLAVGIVLAEVVWALFYNTLNFDRRVSSVAVGVWILAVCVATGLASHAGYFDGINNYLIGLFR